MEKKFLQKKIKEYFINKKFQEWNKETVDYLLMLIKINEYKEYHNMLFLLLNDYLLWLKNNNNDINNTDDINDTNSIDKYTYEDVLNFKNDLHDKLYNQVIEKDDNRDRIYINDFGDDDIIEYNYFSAENILYFIFFMLCLLVIRFLFSLINHHNYDYNSYEHYSKFIPIIEHHNSHITPSSPPKSNKSNIINTVLELLLNKFI